jgi:hypothetical protein
MELMPVVPVRRNIQAPITIEQDDATSSKTSIRAGYTMIAYESQRARKAQQYAGYAGEPETVSIKRKWRRNENENPQTVGQRQTPPKATSTHPRAMFRTRFENSNPRPKMLCAPIQQP